MKGIFLVLLFATPIVFFCFFNPEPNRRDWQEWVTNYDGSVGCPKYPLISADAGMSVDSENVMTLTANTGRVPGLFMNAISGKHHTFIDDSRYTFSGSFRKPAGAQNEIIDVNLQLVIEHIEYHIEISWGNNPFSPLYGWVWTRYKLDEEIKLFHLGDDTNWHEFEVVADYTSNPPRRIAHSLRVDDEIFILDHEMGTNPKEWESSFMTLLETHNMYTACSPSLTFVGKSQWKDIKLKRSPLTP